MSRSSIENVKNPPLSCQRGLMVIALRPRYTGTPTEVRMYPDRGTHVSRPRYAHFTTEMSIHHDQDEHTRRPKCGDQAAPTTYHPLFKKRHSFLQSCAFFCGGGKKREEGVCAALLVRCGTHVEQDASALHYVVVGDVVLLIFLKWQVERV